MRTHKEVLRLEMDGILPWGESLKTLRKLHPNQELRIYDAQAALVTHLSAGRHFERTRPFIVLG